MRFQPQENLSPENIVPTVMGVINDYRDRKGVLPPYLVMDERTYLLLYQAGLNGDDCTGKDFLYKFHDVPLVVLSPISRFYGRMLQVPMIGRDIPADNFQMKASHED